MINDERNEENDVTHDLCRPRCKTTKVCNPFGMRNSIQTLKYIANSYHGSVTRVYTYLHPAIDRFQKYPFFLEPWITTNNMILLRESFLSLELTSWNFEPKRILFKDVKNILENILYLWSLDPMNWNFEMKRILFKDVKDILEHVEYFTRVSFFKS